MAEVVGLNNATLYQRHLSQICFSEPVVPNIGLDKRKSWWSGYWSACGRICFTASISEREIELENKPNGKWTLDAERTWWFWVSLVRCLSVASLSSAPVNPPISIVTSRELAEEPFHDRHFFRDILWTKMQINMDMFPSSFGFLTNLVRVLNYVNVQIFPVQALLLLVTVCASISDPSIFTKISRLVVLSANSLCGNKKCR